MYRGVLLTAGLILNSSYSCLFDDNLMIIPAQLLDYHDLMIIHSQLFMIIHVYLMIICSLLFVIM